MKPVARKEELKPLARKEEVKQLDKKKGGEAASQER